MHLVSLSRTRPLSPFSKKSISTSAEFQNSIQVCILGAGSPLGRMTSFLMKQNPLISLLRLHGPSTVHNLVADLESFDTRCKTLAFGDETEVAKALRGADVILMLGSKVLKENTPMVDRVVAEGKRIYDLTQECINYAPRSIIVVNVPPVSVTTPLVAAAFKETNWYHPGRIIGSAALAQVKANSVLGRYQDLDPLNCQVPLIGGPDVDLAVPLFSRAKPIELNDMISQGLLAKFRGIKENQFPKITSVDNYVENCTLSEAFALNNLITIIGMGICGDKAAFCNAFMRTNVLKTCQYLVTTVQFSRGGVVHNFGIPQLTKLELRMLEKATLKIKERQEMAEEFLKSLKEGNNSVPAFKVKDIERQKLLQQNIVT